MKRIFRIGNSGSFNLNAAVVLLAVVMIFCFYLEYARIYNVVNETRENSITVLRSYVDEVSNEISKTLANGEDYKLTLDTNMLRERLKTGLSLNTSMVKTVNGKEVYRITGVTLTSERARQVKLIADITVSVPVRFAGYPVFYVSPKIRISALLKSKEW